MKSIKIETRDYYLLNLKTEHATKEYLSWLHDYQISRNLETNGSEQTISSLKEYILFHDNHFKFLFGIFSKKNKRHIGTFSVRIVAEHQRASIGLLIGNKDYWGTGVVNECREKIIDWLFESKNVEKIEAGPMSTNYPAIFNFQKQGWSQEGIIKNHYLIDGKNVDSVLFGMTKESWLNQKKDI